MAYLEITSNSCRLECTNCGSHTYAARCGISEGTALVPLSMLTPRVRRIADGLEAHSPPVGGGVPA